jgi:superfamily II DNA or RNA helicase
MEMYHLNPATIVLPTENDQVKRFLTFTDRQVKYQIQKLKQNFRWKNSNPDSFELRLNQLKDQEKKCLLFTDPETGLPCTYSGLWQDLNNVFGWNLKNNFTELNGKTLPWQTQPPTLRYYQKSAVDALINSKHGAISLPTGAGKSLIIISLCKELGLKTVIVTPSKAITNQIYKDFVNFFGKKWVGKFGDGKKELDKLFTVCVAQSLVRLEPKTKEWDFFKDTQALIWDESHTTPAETFDKVCVGALKNAPYRFFLSATQIRTDGSELLLRGITGPIVYSKDFKELVEEGFLKKPIFKIFNVPSTGYVTGNIDEETRHNLYLNPNVNKLAGEIAHKAINLANRQTVIIIDEFKQFLSLKNYITVPFEFVHGGATDREDSSGVKLKDLLPEEFWNSDIEGAVKRFNEGKTKLLIGTSAISTGVDLKPVGCLIYLQGGLSEIKVKQAIGRGTRKSENLNDFWVIDFKINGSPAMERHANERIGIYMSMGDVTEHTVI